MYLWQGAFALLPTPIALALAGAFLCAGLGQRATYWFV